MWVLSWGLFRPILISHTCCFSSCATKGNCPRVADQQRYAVVKMAGFRMGTCTVLEANLIFKKEDFKDRLGFQERENSEVAHSFSKYLLAKALRRGSSMEPRACRTRKKVGGRQNPSPSSGL